MSISITRVSLLLLPCVVVLQMMDGILFGNCTIFFPDKAARRHIGEVMFMKVGFIGAGRVGVTLGRYFCQQGVEVAGYYSRSRRSADEAAAFTATNIYACAGDLLADSDVLFFTVPDDCIASCYEALCREAGGDIQGKIFCHASGAMTAEAAFAGIEAAGAFGYSVHPLFAVSDKMRAYSELPDVFFTLEGSGERREFMLAWLRGTGLNVHLIPGECKVKYHAAAAIVSNQVVALFAEGQRLLEECGFAPLVAQQALRPIFLGNAAHVAEDGAAAALTGPVQRGDTGTVAKHLSVLDRTEDRLLYLLLSRRLAELASVKNSEYDDTSMQSFLDEAYKKCIAAAAAEGCGAGRKEEFT